MADLAYTSTLQEIISVRLFGKAYTDLLTVEKTALDNTWSSGSLTGGVAKLVLSMVQQRSQAYYLAGATAAPDVWEHVFVTACCLYLAKTFRRSEEDMRNWWREYKEAWTMARESFTLDPATTASLANTALSLKGMRFYVLDKGSRLSPPRFFSTSAVDDATHWVANFCWNNSQWRLRQRQGRMLLNRLELSNATWTESTKTLTKTSGFTNYPSVTAGDRIRITDGTGVVLGDYLVASRTSANAITLATSISELGVDLSTGDIDGVITFIRFFGLGASETVDAIGSQRLYYDDATAEEGDCLRWGDSDEIALAKSNADTGRPKLFHIEERVGSGKMWHFAPEPDQEYTLRGQFLIEGPGTFSSSTDTTVMAKFPPEMLPHFKQLVLAQVYRAHGIKEGDDLWREAVEAVNRLFARYEDAGGQADGHPAPMDVYRDVDALGGQIGGAM